MTQRWRQRPEGSNWGDFGPDDQLGRLNLLTDEAVLQAAVEIRTGKRFCLSLPLNYPGGNVLVKRRFPPRLQAVVRGDTFTYNFAVGTEQPGATDVVNDDLVVLHTQYSTQWDSLAHVGSMFDVMGEGTPEKVYYNGFRAGEHLAGPDGSGALGGGARALGIEGMARSCVQGRGVLIDLEAHFGREFRRVSYDDLMRVMEADKVVIEPGDMACFHTGFGQQLLDWGGSPDPDRVRRICCGLDGRDARLRRWVDESGVSVLIADNLAVELLDGSGAPGGHGPSSPLHELCLFKLGVHLGELWSLSELAAWLRQNQRSRFLLTAPPLRLPGAVGSPVTPVATV